jgi:hypothetical protein
MSIIDLFTVISAAAVTSERVVEIFKPVYLKFKNKAMKARLKDCTKLEKITMSMFFSILICILAQIGIDIPVINESHIVQQIFAGLVASYGSNVLHILLSILTIVKNNREVINGRNHAPEQ